MRILKLVVLVTQQRQCGGEITVQVQREAEGLDGVSAGS